MLLPGWIEVKVHLNLQTGEVLCPEENKEAEKWFQDRIHRKPLDIEKLHKLIILKFSQMLLKDPPDGNGYTKAAILADSIYEQFGTSSLRAERVKEIIEEQEALVKDMSDQLEENRGQRHPNDEEEFAYMLRGEKCKLLGMKYLAKAIAEGSAQ